MLRIVRFTIGPVSVVRDMARVVERSIDDQSAEVIANVIDCSPIGTWRSGYHAATSNYALSSQRAKKSDMIRVLRGAASTPQGARPVVLLILAVFVDVVGAVPPVHSVGSHGVIPG